MRVPFLSSTPLLEVGRQNGLRGEGEGELLWACLNFSTVLKIDTPSCTPSQLGSLDVKCHSWAGKQCDLSNISVSSSCCILHSSEIGTAGKKSHPGLWPIPLHLQSANCHGDEKALLQCGYQEAVSGTCNQGSAMAMCVPPEGKSPGEVHYLFLVCMLPEIHCYCSDAKSEVRKLWRAKHWSVFYFHLLCRLFPYSGK